MKCSGKVYGMHVSMTQQSENFQRLIYNNYSKYKPKTFTRLLPGFREAH